MIIFFRTGLVWYFRRIRWADGGEECSGQSLSSPCRDGSTTLGNGMYEELTSISGYVCNGLFSIGEDSFGTRRMTTFCKLFGIYYYPGRKFSPIKDRPCTKNAKFKRRIAQHAVSGSNRLSSFTWINISRFSSQSLYKLMTKNKKIKIQGDFI